jgi:group I intron endonuclease
MTKAWTIYRHKSPSGKIYIGITSRPAEKRWNGGKGYTACIFFYKAILKYGWDNIKHEILFTNLEESRAKSLEVDLIRHYKNLGISYNITDGGDGTTGYRHSEATLIKLRRALKGRESPNKGIPMRESTKEKLSKLNKGKSLPVEVRMKISQSNSGVNHPFYGKELNREHRYKISQAHTGIKLGDNMGFGKRSKSRDKYCKAVEQLDEDLNIIKAFRSATDAARFYNKSKSAASKITECCRGTRNKTLNSKWRYKYG